MRGSPQPIRWWAHLITSRTLTLHNESSTPRKHETTASTKLRLNKNNQKEESEALHGDGTTKVYLGNGCFWARQYALVTVEQHR